MATDISFKFATAFLIALSMCQPSFWHSPLLPWPASSSHKPAVCFSPDLLPLPSCHCKFTASICAFLPICVKYRPDTSHSAAVCHCRLLLVPLPSPPLSAPDSFLGDILPTPSPLLMSVIFPARSLHCFGLTSAASRLDPPLKPSFPPAWLFLAIQHLTPASLEQSGENGAGFQPSDLLSPPLRPLVLLKHRSISASSLDPSIHLIYRLLTVSWLFSLPAER